jgi:leucyl/phenylalanyl-tRNA--protein transferase
VPRRTYKQLLRAAMDHDAHWDVWPSETIISGAEVLDAIADANRV